MIYFSNVSKQYPDDNDLSLSHVTLTISQGEFVSIVGHSGAGKTTFTKLILAEEKPTEGTVFYQSKNVHQLSSAELTKLRKKIGVIFQDYRLLPNKTTYENIAFAMEAAGRDDEEIANDVPHVLDLVDLGSKMHHFPNQLSGGEQQRVALARALIHRPKMIIADEPTGNLDPRSSEEIIHLLLEINSYGTTVLLATHNKHVVDEIGKRVIVLDDGMVIGDEMVGKYVQADKHTPTTKTF